MRRISGQWLLPVAGATIIILVLTGIFGSVPYLGSVFGAPQPLSVVVDGAPGWNDGPYGAGGSSCPSTAQPFPATFSRNCLSVSTTLPNSLVVADLWAYPNCLFCQYNASYPMKFTAAKILGSYQSGSYTLPVTTIISDNTNGSVWTGPVAQTYAGLSIVNGVCPGGPFASSASAVAHVQVYAAAPTPGVFNVTYQLPLVNGRGYLPTVTGFVYALSVNGGAASIRPILSSAQRSCQGYQSAPNWYNNANYSSPPAPQFADPSQQPVLAVESIISFDVPGSYGCTRASAQSPMSLVVSDNSGFQFSNTPTNWNSTGGDGEGYFVSSSNPASGGRLLCPNLGWYEYSDLWAQPSSALSVVDLSAQSVGPVPIAWILLAVGVSLVVLPLLAVRPRKSGSVGSG